MSASNIEYSPHVAEIKALGIIFGRFMLPDMTEHACQVIDVTMNGATFMSEIIPPRGQTIVAYLEDIGRIEAVIGSSVSGGFQISFALQGSRLERLQHRIQGLRDINKNSPDSRRHARFEPSEKVSQIVLSDGRVYACEVLDISISGAAVKTEVMPSVGTFVMLGKMRGRVVRYLDQGVAIEFVKQLALAQMPAVTGASLL